MTPRAPRDKRWVVREGDGTTVGEIVKRAGENESAFAEGRVFVGRRRVSRGADPVAIGDEVRIGAGTIRTPIEVLWERDGLVACVKPAGMPTIPDHAGAAHALVALVAESRGRRTDEMFVTSRLDREVSGVVVFATTEAAKARLEQAREEGRYRRRYVAIAAGELDGSRGVWDAPIGRGRDARHRAVRGPEEKAARTHFAVVARTSTFALLAVEPQTGRTHQIRVHAADAGAPLLGDRDYGGPMRVVRGDGRVVALARIALHAAEVTVPDAAGAPLVASAPIPEELVRASADLGGAAPAWETAARCPIPVRE